MATRATTVQISMPQMGESVTEGTILEWLKQVGDHVDADEPLVEVSTDKVDAEVPAPASGTLTKILAEPDSTVQVGAVLGEIEVGDNGSAPEAPTAAEEPPPAEAELTDVAFPEMGDSVAEGTVLEWRVAVGDQVAVDDPLVEISTDKVDADLPSPVAGTVAEILAEPDTTVAVGTVLCRIAAGAEAPAPAPARPTEPADAPTPAPAGNGAANATPVAVRVAGAHGLDLGAVKGSGPRGRVTKEDVLAALEGGGQPQAAEVKPIRGPAATLARFMDESRSIPTATSFRTLTVDVLDARRRELKDAGRKLSFTHLIAWADRPGRARHARDGQLVHRGGRQAAARGARRRSASAWPWTSSARTAPARWWCRCSPAPASSPSRTSWRATTSWWRARATTRCPRTPTPAPTSASPTPAESGPSRASRASCRVRARSSRPARSATRPASARRARTRSGSWASRRS